MERIEKTISELENSKEKLLNLNKREKQTNKQKKPQGQVTP